ncbi:NAD(P)-dependent dehydrogenase (short-subunit alcohol dehydrogenase family) [Stella humosa]|uniref:NAD(P)-dependent dehydrogenase (Short-subunit alcohol dehydrogenase family) n=1 Tax=Stella humosa TaxID=94 RepID=A0A3N1M6Y1_9PROT|nr:glucose 1-dehydrogenase [Stella humosa]ROP99472.1 NAD(P)-dependent dehydrogenase (short-subunit alcohol dehydrogenase family) [Stella humosa]BBK31316.1 short-chain dehydrogenase [Stella humosa]
MAARVTGRVAGKVALVTGAGGGLGRAFCRALAGEGAQVVATDRDLAAAAATADECGGLALALDVTDEAAWIATMAEVARRLGRLDVLVNNAGIAILNTIEDTTIEEWRLTMGVNLDGVFLGCKHGIGLMKATGGSIINLSSVSGLVGGHNLAAYNASKGGVRLLTKSVALHCARAGYGIRCNSVHPSFVNTPMVDGMLAGAPDPEGTRRRLARQIPLGRMGETDDIAPLVVYLASDESRFVTGSEMVVDGGLTAA